MLPACPDDDEPGNWRGWVSGEYNPAVRGEFAYPEPFDRL
jgi:hypothetical protein